MNSSATETNIKSRGTKLRTFATIVLGTAMGAVISLYVNEYVGPILGAGLAVLLLRPFKPNESNGQIAGKAALICIVSMLLVPSLLSLPSCYAGFCEGFHAGYEAYQER